MTGPRRSDPEATTKRSMVLAAKARPARCTPSQMKSCPRCSRRDHTQLRNKTNPLIAAQGQAKGWATKAAPSRSEAREMRRGVGSENARRVISIDANHAPVASSCGQTP